MMLRSTFFGAAAAIAGFWLLAPTASAAPFSFGADSVAQTRMLDTNVSEAQYRHRGARVMAGPRVGGVYRGPRRGYGGAAVGAGLALGILGAAAAASAASGPGYYGECYITRQPVHDAWGNYVGSRRVRVCD